MSNPILSIIVPIYNVKQYLPHCLNSLISQTFFQIEILCIDDGSQDGSVEIVLAYQEKDSRVRLFCQEHQGVSAARNLGIRNARGKYIAFVDSDDWVDRDLYQHMVNTAEKTCCDMVVCATEVHPEAPDLCDLDALVDLQNCLTVTEGQWQASDDTNHIWRLLDRSGIWPFIWNKVIRRSCVQENSISFPTALTLGEDGVFIQLLLPYLQRVAFVSKAAYHYRYMRKESATVRLFQEEERRFGHHLDVVRELLREYTDRNLIQNYGSLLLKWLIHFLYFGFVNLPVWSRKKYAIQIREIFQEFYLDRYCDGLDILKRIRISRMLSSHHFAGFRKLEIWGTIAQDRLFRWY